MTTLIGGRQGYTGGINGITDLRTLLGWDIRTDHAKYILYFVNGGLLIAAILLCGYVRHTRLGRTPLIGAVYGTLLVNGAKTLFSEDFPQLWLFAMGALFIGVVLAFPNGLA